ncbi:transglutaminase-like domain-containing protein [Pelotomaculum propionicicum]|uniref:transglutaminase-like domain-containing protein n=1 Tax=Pelotomaculum propionicicum TaxID=258475 RepID=UPI003B827165
MYLWKSHKNKIIIVLSVFLIVLTGCNYEKNQNNLNDYNKNIIINDENNIDSNSNNIDSNSNNNEINWNQFLDLWIKAEVSESDINTARKEILSAILAYHVEEIVEGAENDQDKCIRIAKWIASNIPNREPLGQDEYGWYAYRSGLCGSRAMLFVEMLKYQHIPARVFNMYNFGRVGGGHSCAQAYYDAKWHFFDVTYAGTFIKNNDVLSWEEILSNPKDAMGNLVVFEDNLDRWGAVTDDPVNRDKVNNNERMHIAYNEEILKNAKSYGFYQYSDVKTLYPLIDWDNIVEDKLFIGNLNNDFNDVNIDGVNKKLSEQLGVSLGTGTDTFHTTWIFNNCIPGEVYSIKYYIYKSNLPDLAYWARSEDVKIISGGTFISSESLVNGDLHIWEIKFTPIESECSISVGYDFREQQKLLFTDMIEIIR